MLWSIFRIAIGVFVVGAILWVGFTIMDVGQRAHTSLEAVTQRVIEAGG